MNYVTKENYKTLTFFQVPKALITNEKYKDLKANALKLYMVLLDRMRLSMKNKWSDENGYIYCYLSQKQAVNMFGWSPTTFRSMKKELESYGLLEQFSTTGGSNKLYVCQVEHEEVEVYQSPEKEEETIKEPSSKSDEGGQNLTTSKNEPNNNKNYKELTKNIVNKKLADLEEEYFYKGLSKDLLKIVRSEVKPFSESIKNPVAYYRSVLSNVLHKHELKHGKRKRTKLNHLSENHPLNFDWLNSDLQEALV